MDQSILPALWWIFGTIAAIAVEETVRRQWPDFLAYAWLLILSVATWQILSADPIERLVITMGRNMGNGPLSYVAAAAVGAVLFLLYWHGITSLLATAGNQMNTAIVTPLRFREAEITIAPGLYRVAVPFVNGGPGVLPEFRWISGGVVSDRVLTAEAEEAKWHEFLSGPAGDRGKWSLPEDLGVEDIRRFYTQVDSLEELDIINSRQDSQLYLFGMATYRNEAGRYRVDLCRRFHDETWHTCFGHNRTIREE